MEILFLGHSCKCGCNYRFNQDDIITNRYQEGYRSCDGSQYHYTGRIIEERFVNCPVCGRTHMIDEYYV